MTTTNTNPTTEATALRHEIFSAGFLPAAGDAEPQVDQRTADWFRAVRTGFHEQPYTAPEVARLAGTYQVDGRVLVGVYDDEAPAPSLDAGIPVATFAEFRKTLNTGAGNLVESHLITVVTVRPSHRRRGILRRMMTDSLDRARDAGLPIAALTASEATIYGRFGFGPATTLDSVRVDVKGGLPLVAPPEGQVVAVDPASLQELAPALFERFHASHRGSIGRQEAYTLRATGRLAEDAAKDDPTLRAAVHLDDEGTPQGFLTYSFAGWNTSPVTMKVRDLVAATAAARRELWRYLGAHDLVERVEYGAAAPDDALPWMIDDPRRVTVTETEDLLWLRILDVPAALRARQYGADGSLRLRVTDALGYADGTWEVSVAGGTARVDAAADAGPADLELDVALLGSLYLGGTSVRALAEAGRLRASSDEALARACTLLDLPGAPYAINGF
ncbi:GNAT family N-acetyltransferase [Arthrobacter sp.]|uniref:GNAT family N-acetyltransferase n=1 Tax=Arthrobacter sp. TaxID=1667 RepID=UPI003A90F205